MSLRNVVTFTYTNHRGETRLRTVEPYHLWYGNTTYHPLYQWLVHARDVETGNLRDFALSHIAGWKECVVEDRREDPVGNPPILACTGRETYLMG